MNSMNILYFTTANLFLRRSHVYNILKTAEAVGIAGNINVTVVSVRKKENTIDEIFSRHALDRKRLTIILRRGGMVSAIKYLSRKRETFDIFYFRAPRLFLYAFYAKVFLGKKVIFEMHRMPRSFWERPLWSWSLRLADKVIFITRTLKSRYPDFARKGEVVYLNTYDPQLFDAVRGLSQDTARRQLGLPRDKKLIVYSGNTLTYDFKPLFKALSGMKNVYFVIVGVTNPSYLNTLVEREGMRDRVRFVSRVNRMEVPLYLVAGDILVVPFVRNEPGAFPVKIFEYFGAGRPIVSFKNECIGEVLRDRKNAILIDPPTTRNWQKAIEELINDNKLASRLGKQGLKETPYYTWRRRGEQIYALLKEVYYEKDIE